MFKKGDASSGTRTYFHHPIELSDVVEVLIHKWSDNQHIREHATYRSELQCIFLAHAIMGENYSQYWMEISEMRKENIDGVCVADNIYEEELIFMKLYNVVRRIEVIHARDVDG